MHGNTQLFLVDTVIGGKPVKALAQPDRNGFFYLLDRTNGKFLRATQYVEQLTWAKGIDKKGRPIVDPATLPQENSSARVCPSNLGGMNGSWTGAYDPATGLIFAPSIESCQLFRQGHRGLCWARAFPIWAGCRRWSMPPGRQGLRPGVGDRRQDRPGQMALSRPEADDGRCRRDRRRRAVHLEHGGRGARARPGDGRPALVVPDGRGNGRGQPIVYQIDGTTYVAIPSGGLVTFDAMLNGKPMIPEGGQLFVFALDQ